MEKMVSSVNSISSNTKRQIEGLKATQDDTTSRLASETTGVIGNSDPDHLAFLTPAFKEMQLFQTGNNAGVVGTLALMPKQQHASLETPYYKSGTPFALDRAGSGNFGFNIARAGVPPDGYYGGDKVLVQKRFKIYPAGESYPDIFVYGPPVEREEPKGYVLQTDERYSGNFYPGALFAGVAPLYGNTFPTNAQGQYVYNNAPFMNSGWDGSTYSVAYNLDTKPVIDYIDPDHFDLPDKRLPGEHSGPTIYGHNFSGAGYVMIGPYLPQFIGPGSFGGGGLNGASQYREVLSDSIIRISVPSTLDLNFTGILPGVYDNTTGILPGVYDIYVIGADGQIGVLEQCFTVNPAPEAP